MSNYNNSNKRKPMSKSETVPLMEMTLKEQEYTMLRHAIHDKMNLARQYEQVARQNQEKAEDLRIQAEQHMISMEGLQNKDKVRYRSDFELAVWNDRELWCTDIDLRINEDGIGDSTFLFHNKKGGGSFSMELKSFNEKRSTMPNQSKCPRRYKGMTYRERSVEMQNEIFSVINRNCLMGDRGYINKAKAKESGWMYAFKFITQCLNLMKRAKGTNESLYFAIESSEDSNKTHHVMYNFNVNTGEFKAITKTVSREELEALDDFTKEKNNGSLELKVVPTELLGGILEALRKNEYNK